MFGGKTEIAGPMNQVWAREYLNDGFRGIKRVKCAAYFASRDHVPMRGYQVVAFFSLENDYAGVIMYV